MVDLTCALISVYYQPGAVFLEQITSIKIVGLDANRPPKIRKQPYIDIFFELSLKAPKDWCEDFNRLGKHLEPSVKINQKEGLFIEAWVRNMEDIPKHLHDIKEKIINCNEQYIENIRLKELAEIEKNQALGKSPEQERLSIILSNLEFNN